VDPADVLLELVGLAREAGLEVRELRPRGGEGEGAARSGACRLQGRIWVLLAPHDPLEDRIDVLARALVEHAPDALEGRWLPPAVRARLER